MADLQAPYMTGTDLTQMPGDPALGGVQANFDPANKKPLEALQNTFDRIDSENNQARENEKQRQFTAQQQQRQFQHDLLSRKMDMEQQMKILQVKQAIAGRDDFYKMMSDMRVRGGQFKDANGNPMPINPLPEDQQQLDDQAKGLNKIVLSNPANYRMDSDFQKQMAAYEANTANATARSRFSKEAQIALSQTGDPEEQKNILNYLDGIKNSPLTQVPNPYVSPTLAFQQVVDPSKFKDKDMEEFDNGKGIPQAQYNRLLTTMDGGEINQGFRTYQAFKRMPEGQDPKAYQDYQNHLNEILAERGEAPIDLGGQIQNGKVVFDESTRPKQLALSRKFLFADQMLHSGHITPYSEDEKTESAKKKADLAKVQADTQKDLVEANLKGKDMKAVRSVYNDVQKVFDVSAKKPMYVSDATKSLISRSGVNLDNTSIYPLSAGSADRFVGKEAGSATTTTYNSKGQAVEKETTPKGASEKPDASYLVINKNTGQKEILYIKDGKLLNRVSEKDAVINGLKHDAKYDQSKYEDKVSLIDDAYKEAAEKSSKPAATSSSSTTDKTEAAIKARWVPVTIKKKDGSLTKAYKDPQTGKIYSAT